MDLMIILWVAELKNLMLGGKKGERTLVDWGGGGTSVETEHMEEQRI